NSTGYCVRIYRPSPRWPKRPALLQNELQNELQNDAPGHTCAGHKEKDMDKVVASPEEAIADVTDGSTVAIAGFSVAHGFANSLILALRAKGTKNLTLVCNSLGDSGATRGQIL